MEKSNSNIKWVLKKSALWNKVTHYDHLSKDDAGKLYKVYFEMLGSYRDFSLLPCMHAARGYEAQLRGQKLEKKIADTFRKKGFKVRVNVRIKGAEFDVTDKKEGGWFSNDEWGFVECKNKPKVTPADFKKFLGNFRIFCKKRKLDEKEVKRYFYTTGVFDPTVVSQARQFSNIMLKRMRNV